MDKKIIDKRLEWLAIKGSFIKMVTFVEFINFLQDGFLGKYAEIKEKSIDDAFDCMIDRDKVFIKTSNLSKAEKEAKINQAECESKLMKELFKSSLKPKH